MWTWDVDNDGEVVLFSEGESQYNLDRVLSDLFHYSLRDFDNLENRYAETYPRRLSDFIENFVKQYLEN